MTEIEVKDYIQGLLDEGAEDSHVESVFFSKEAPTVFGVWIGGYVTLTILEDISLKFGDDDLWIYSRDGKTKITVNTFPKTLEEFKI